MAVRVTFEYFTGVEGKHYIYMEYNSRKNALKKILANVFEPHE